MKQPKPILVLFTKKLLLFSIPFFLFLLLYIALDPFHVIYSEATPTSLHWNRDVEGSRLLLKNLKKYHYTSFILGNSKSMGFRTRDWGKYISDSTPFHWDASSEDIAGVYSKLKYLDKIGNPLKNVLIITDPAMYIGTDHEERFGFNQDYKINNSPFLRFHFIFFKGFYTYFFFVSYLDYSIFNTYRAYMKNTIPGDWSQYTFDSITNDYILYKRIQKIKSDSLGFYKNTVFYQRDTNISEHWQCIDEKCLNYLHDIRDVFYKHKTKYKIVISPLYSQEYFNKHDLKILQNIFGMENVFDFSGKNIYTYNTGNYYDNIHYKPLIGKMMLQYMYSNQLMSQAR